MDSLLDFNWRRRVTPNEGERALAAGFVLAGGRSSRMGHDKALLMLDCEPLIAKGVRKLNRVCVEVAIAGGSENLAPFGRVISDKNPGCGPLSGIVAALGQSSFKWNLFLPVDAPFVPVSVLKAMLAQAADHPGVCVMARTQGVMQPLCAVYSRDALGVLERELAAGRRKVTHAIEAAGMVKFIDFGDSGWFANLNTPEEFAEAERRIDSLDT